MHSVTSAQLWVVTQFFEVEQVRKAAVDALNYINTLGDCHTNEYAGLVYKDWSPFGPPTFTYDQPPELGPASGVMPLNANSPRYTSHVLQPPVSPGRRLR
jgi:hypothetical protein